ncbi:hypothetical protein, partial [Rhizobium bangladeshense]|uniref:hypothetical protein n=1 Tax=Rhizobium bangladeshense TaxID=1138189 RepID=UPI001C90C5A2
LKAGLWLRRGRFVIMAPVIGIVPGSKAESHLSQMFSFPEPPLEPQVRFRSTAQLRKSGVDGSYSN